MDAAIRALVQAALRQSAQLDEAGEETALKDLGRALATLGGAADEVALTFEQLLERVAALPQRWARLRAFAATCEAIATSRLPAARRIALLEGAARSADRRPSLAEVVDTALLATESLVDAGAADRARNLLGDLAGQVAGFSDDDVQARARLRVAEALTHAGAVEAALAQLEGLEPSADRARVMVLCAGELASGQQPDDATALVVRALGELGAAPDGPEKTAALRTALEVVVEAGLDAPDRDLLGAILDAVDGLRQVRARHEALIGAVESLGRAEISSHRRGPSLTRLRRSIDELADVDARADALGELAVSLAARAELMSCDEVLADLAALAASREMGGKLTTPGGAASSALPATLPLARVLDAFADAGVDPQQLRWLLERAIDRLRDFSEAPGIALLLRQIARFAASPALSYDARVALLERALAIAGRIPNLERRVQAATAIANALSLAGADERGDGLFAGLNLALEGDLARAARLDRAVTLVQLNRTADALATLAAAAATTGADRQSAIVELARATARCGFLADVIQWVGRVEPDRQAAVRSELADLLAETRHLDANLRVIGLDSLARDAPPTAAAIIRGLVAQVRIVEGLGDPAEVLTAALDEARSLPEHGLCAILESQLVSAAIGRIHRLGTARGRDDDSHD